jgi:hypothetical protein
MLTNKDPMAAVDVYCKFPVSENPTFDDAYIIGDIVRLIMKAEKYDDPRLQPNMIAYGKVLGLGNILETERFFLSYIIFFFIKSNKSLT